MAKTEGRTLPLELGTVKIADEVVSIIAGLAATEVKGVASMSGGITGGISEVLGRKNFSKGVKVEVGTEEAKVDIFISVKYGERIPDVAWAIQESVKKAIESMTGLKVSSVNVHVQGVQFPQQENSEAEKAESDDQVAAENEQ
ncbi:MAG: Asp23/Gls24 family envelope stress response protein [Firmicutes bacterium]|nr:Asp23/Gls24 family envelope stress response protein [Bacillota bacterium]